jgi:glycerol-3-phosphate dehydrogenase
VDFLVSIGYFLVYGAASHQLKTRLKSLMAEFSWRTRRESLAKFAEETFDVLIIGGGITGAGLALDASLRRLRAALVEKRDFAAGTSSRSTKLIHGGLRYLEHFDLALVREGLGERAILTKIAPHLTQPFPFVIPVYKNSRRNYDHPLKMRAGLWLYDLLAGKYNFARHRRLDRDEALRLAPQLDPQGLKCAFLYYDARTNDSRLVIEVVKAAHERGARLVNYTRAIGFIRDGNGKIVGARLRDELTGAEVECRARIVINATGVWMEETMKLNGQPAKSPDKSVRPSKGVHLTVSADRLQVSSAWLIPALNGHRFYFVVPWQGRVNIGTTDTDYDGDKDHPRAERDEINEILGAINSYFPEARLEPADVISSWAGLRPLITDPRAKKTSDVSRKEETIETGDGLISIGGGKLTTYRLMAEHGIDLAAKRLNERFNVTTSNGASTKNVAISGGELGRSELAVIAERLSQTENLPPETAQHLVYSYGANYQRLVELMREDEQLRERLVEGLPQLLVEVVYAARHEMALTLADVMTRRLRLAMLAGEDSLRRAAVAADLMARELGWNPEEVARQVARFVAEFEREFAAPNKLV